MKKGKIISAAIFILLSLPLALFSAYGQTPVQDRCVHGTLKHQGMTREYYLYTPDGLKEGAPLVLCLHGYGGSAANGKVELMDAADTHGFAICYPDGSLDPKGKKSWNVGYPFQKGMKADDVDFIAKLSKSLKKEYGFSEAFLTGMSNGGEMCYLTAQRKPEAFKAIASIAGLTLTDMMPLRYKKPVPFMEVHGTEDRTSEWTGDPENKGGWGAYMAVPAALSHIIAANGCVSETITRLPRKEGRNQVILYHFQGGAADVLVYKVIGGNHSWSDKDMDTCDAILEFFETYL
ncbi:MAG: esterase [Bacteroidales bacterium]|nr:esterase [Bacteroidales bacterium]